MVPNLLPNGIKLEANQPVVKTAIRFLNDSDLSKGSQISLQYSLVNATLMKCGSSQPEITFTCVISKRPIFIMLLVCIQFPIQ